MLITRTHLIHPNFTSKKRTTILAQKRQNSPTKQPSLPFVELKVPNPNLVRAGVALLGLGFVDAGYSGDWSRIGVITQQTEQLLKLAAFLVVPLCFAFIFSLSGQTDD